MGWMPTSFLFLLRPFPVSRYCSVPVSPIPFPILVSFFLPSNSGSKSGENCKLPTVPSEKWQPVAKVGGNKIHSVPVISRVGGDASHGSHSAVVPTILPHFLVISVKSNLNPTAESPGSTGPTLAVRYYALTPATRRSRKRWRDRT